MVKERCLLLVDGMNIFFVANIVTIMTPIKKFIIAKEDLENFYIKEQWSMEEIANYYSCSAQTICNNIKKYNIPVRSSAEHSERTKKKITESRLGEKNPMYGKKRPEHARLISELKKGWVPSEETRQKMSLAKNGLWSGKYKGSDCPHWVEPNKRKTPLYKQIRDSIKMKEWRMAIFIRDNWTCQICNNRGSIQLNADHIKPFYLLIKENKILNLEQAIECDILWDIKNGRTLCVDCHKQTETWGRPKK